MRHAGAATATSADACVWHKGTDTLLPHAAPAAAAAAVSPCPRLPSAAAAVPPCPHLLSAVATDAAVAMASSTPGGAFPYVPCCDPPSVSCTMCENSAAADDNGDDDSGSSKKRKQTLPNAQQTTPSTAETGSTQETWGKPQRRSLLLLPVPLQLPMQGRPH